MPKKIIDSISSRAIARMKNRNVIKKPKSGGITVIPKAKRLTIKRVGTVAVDSGTFCVVDPHYGSEAEGQERADIAKKKYTIVSKQLNWSNGNPLAVIHVTGIGDGFFPVFAEYEGRHVRRVWVDLPGDIDRNGPPTVPARRRRRSK